MERRSSERKRIHEGVTLESPRWKRSVATTRDMSLGGMYVEPDGLPENTTVNVSFSLPTDAGARELFVMDALVVRHGAKGSGLMFIGMDGASIRALSAALARAVAAQH